ncbi:spore germination protein GerPE [Bacillus sp. 31A1R]|uniref:Spore germination protein GerPE n=1 Tax=Robertmurraya mangrovi TaxID=3098077 RepID=A0ABU5IT21_9BACI|nr:spore germination protein GerPE [Bacillus sp. 31A1R]MDZ5470271.1 spore germination protein GerPE [Bacillus sp. 31A1R]
MLQRTSSVDRIKVDGFAFSSIFQIGDSTIINGLNRALAVQRERELFFGREGNFRNYPIYSIPIPLPQLTEPLTFQSHPLNPIIKVNNIQVIAFSSSSVLHVGNSKHINMEARIKHIRQLLPKTDQAPD